ncbi:hypothetical protein OIY81_341 [Cryptosporidium canis]|uniref:Uncharacterized protein n=1 Tax=Cryptosporidium canis TaxID=195482 RepID=A0ABQ8P9Z6_9CRYT|nr:hypothetical protein OJ252_1846 [Cryptosporidium canis]KAJ1614591.1 hypothetical protein OIY81_341 [Cryptosporidium canis]
MDDSLVGIILTVKWPYQEPEIIFHYPPSSISTLNGQNVNHNKECFGQECSKLAPLILPSDSQLWNKMSDLVIESKEFQYRFTFFPCTLIKNKYTDKALIDQVIQDAKFSTDSLILNKSIEAFSISLVFIASAFINYEFVQKKVIEIVNSLLICEVANNFISKEILKNNETSIRSQKITSDSGKSCVNGIFHFKEQRNIYGIETNQSEQLSSTIETTNRLAKKLIQYYSSIEIEHNITIISSRLKSSNEFANYYIWDGSTEDLYDKLTIFIDKEKLSKIYNENELINEISKVADPHLSIRDISVELLEHPSNILSICQKLISKGIAKVTTKIRYDKVYILCPEMIKVQINNFNLEFKDKFDWKGCNPLILASSFFCNGKKLLDVKKELIEFFQAHICQKKTTKDLIYYPYEQQNNTHSSCPDKALEITKSIISWLFIHNCIIDQCPSNAPQ